MDPELIKNEIKTVLEKMSFGEDLESIDLHEGSTRRFSVRMRGGLYPAETNTEDDLQDPSEYRRLSPSRIVIGERGNNLAALEYVLKRILHKKYGDDFKFTLDINDYRIKRLEDLKQDVKDAARAVRLYRKEVPLRPMSSFERRIIHLLLAEYPDITTESIGSEPYRRVVIKPYP